MKPSSRRDRRADFGETLSEHPPLCRLRTQRVWWRSTQKQKSFPASDCPEKHKKRRCRADVGSMSTKVGSIVGVHAGTNRAKYEKDRPRDSDSTSRSPFPADSHHRGFSAPRGRRRAACRLPSLRAGSMRSSNIPRYLGRPTSYRQAENTGVFVLASTLRRYAVCEDRPKTLGATPRRPMSVRWLYPVKCYLGTAPNL